MSEDIPQKSNHLRAIGENNRSPEFKKARGELVGIVSAIFDDLNKARLTADRPFKYGAQFLAYLV